MNGFINNEWDRDNLEFLLNTNDTELAQWRAQADADDLMYAQELLAAYGRELKQSSQDLLIELALDSTNYAEAQAVLARFR